jgi:hypothetical protein
VFGWGLPRNLGSRQAIPGKTGYRVIDHDGDSAIWSPTWSQLVPAARNHAMLAEPPSLNAFDRRRIAVPVRIRQEVHKRILAFRSPRRCRGPVDARPLLADAHPWQTALDRGELVDALAREPQTARFGGPPTVPIPDAHEVIEAAERIARGDWTLLGMPVHIGAGGPAWTRHPESGVEVPLLHFSRLSLRQLGAGGDIKQLWELNRHRELVVLAQAYKLSGDVRFARLAIELLRSWWAANPPEWGPNWVSLLDVAFRQIAWCWVWRWTASSGAWTDETLASLLWYVAEGSRLLMAFDSVHHSPNTHLTGEALGLLYAGDCFPGLRDAARWRQRGVAVLTSEVVHQFLPDGMHYERATGYHRYHVDFYLHASMIARSRNETWDTAWAGPLRAALDASLALRRPDGTWPVLGDEDGGNVVGMWSPDATDQGAALALGFALFGETDWIAGLMPSARSRPWWFGYAVTPMQPMVTASRSFHLPNAGYLGATDSSGWYCLVDAGPHGGDGTGHAHTDLGHVEIAYQSTRVVVDPGSFVYGAIPDRRAHERSLAAHASLVVDDCLLAEPNGPFGWRSVAPTPSLDWRAEGATWMATLRYRTGRQQSVDHVRKVALIHGVGVVVVDGLSGEGEHGVLLNWPLGASSPDRKPVNRTLALPAGLRMQWWTSDQVTATVHPSTYSPSYGLDIPSSRLLLSASAVTLPFWSVCVFSSQRTDLHVAPSADGGVRIRLGTPGAPTTELISSRAGDLLEIVQPTDIRRTAGT